MRRTEHAEVMSETRPEELDNAYQDLRRALAEGQVRDAESIAARISDLLGDQATSSLHNEALEWILVGIGGTLSGEYQNAITTLERITSRDADNETVRWAAWLWTCWAALELGDLERAATAGESLLELSRSMEGGSRSISLCAKAEVDAACGDADQAMEHLVAACEIFESLGDNRGHASACLSQARVLAGMGQDLDSVFAARKALTLAPDWEKPVIFLATMALREGNLELTEQRLADLDQLGPRPQEAQRLEGMVALIKGGDVPLWVVAEYLRLREMMPSDEVVGEIQALTLYSPKLYHLREELAWKQIKLGRYQEAQEVLNRLLEEDLDPPVRASVMLAVSSLASVREPTRPPGARVHAVVAATPPQQTLEAEPPPAKKPEGPAVKEETKSEQWVQRAVETIAGKRSVFSGDLGILCTADLLEFLRNGRRTGTLVLQSQKGAGAVYLRSGMITNASSPNATNIGDLLLDRGAITQDQLGEVASCQREDGRGSLMGGLFIERGMVDADTIKGVLTDQVFNAIRELFPWKEGQFAFLPDPPSAVDTTSVQIELDPQHVLLEVARAIDEDNKE
jgi:tetratricopeptide (TPR) repeat protein